MTDDAPLTRILADELTTRSLSRRSLLRGSALGLVAGGVLLSGCSASGSGARASASPGSLPTTLEAQLNIYNWAQYDDPALVKAFGKAFGPSIQIDTYDSNEAMIAKLAAAQGTSGYDVVVPTGSYVPQLIANKMLMRLDKALLPNLASVDPRFLAQSWDPANEFTVCKDWGSTGYLYDKTVIKRPMATWADFVEAARNEASGSTAVLAEAPEMVGIYFWAHGIRWTTEAKADLDAAEAFFVNDFAQHVKAFDSYPAIKLAQGGYALAQAWNGAARQGLLASKDPGRYAWVLAGPKTELWMDNWAVVVGAKHPVAAHAWINYVLDPKHSLADMSYHGYNTGVRGIEASAKAAGLKYLDLIFFTPDQLAMLETGAINSAEQRLLDIYNKTKAKAG